MSKRAFITGITGQDGWYLSRHLHQLGYEVHGLVRRISQRTWDPPPDVDIRIHAGDVTDQGSVLRAVDAAAPDEIYHLAAQSFVHVSWDQAEWTLRTIVQGTLHVLEAARIVCPHARVYTAGSSEQFGSAPPPQNEHTPFRPRSPYAVAKVAAHHLTRVYRDSYGMFCCTGILFNHESPRRGTEFVTRKIACGVAAIRAGRQQHLTLGNRDARRDWGHARDYVAAMHRMLQQPEPEDYVIGTGETHSVDEFCQLAFARAGLDHAAHVRCDPALMRPAEVPILLADPSKARQRLDWQPTVSFTELVHEMVDHELARYQI